MKIAILMNIFYNYDFIERTLQSIKSQENLEEYELDIYFLENYSVNSIIIKNLINKYNIKGHYMSKTNIAGKIFQLFIKNNIDNIINNYDYICITESDVVLDNNVISESLFIINKYNSNICYTGLKILDKYSSLPLKQWVPRVTKKTDYNIAHTGFQFITFKKQYLIDFITALDNKELSLSIALGSKEYTFISDSNLKLFNNINKQICYQTKYNLLDHIGWEVSLNKHNDYKLIKKNIGNIRQNINLSDINLIKLL